MELELQSIKDVYTNNNVVCNESMNNNLIARVNANSDRVRIQNEKQERLNARRQEELDNIKQGLFYMACFVGTCLIACVLMAIISHYTGIVFD